MTVPCRTPRSGPTSTPSSRCPPTPCTSPQRSSQCVPIPLHSIYLASNSDPQLYGLIFLGSTTAFSAMVSTCIVFLQTSCVIPQAIILYRGRDRVLPKRHFDLGRLGAPINAVAVAWVVFLDLLYCFPTSMPVTPQNMSYVSVVSSGLVVFVVTLWFTTKRSVFKGPRIDWDLLLERRNAAIGGEVLAKADSYVESSGMDVKM